MNLSLTLTLFIRTYCDSEQDSHFDIVENNVIYILSAEENIKETQQQRMSEHILYQCKNISFVNGKYGDFLSLPLSVILCEWIQIMAET